MFKRMRENRMRREALRDAQLEAEAQRAKKNLECMESVRELDHFIEGLRLLEVFVQEDIKKAAWIITNMLELPILNYELPIRSGLMNTRTNITRFLRRYYEKYDTEDIFTVSQALLNVGANHDIHELIELCCTEQKALYDMME